MVFVLWVYLVLFGDYNKYLRDYIPEFLSLGLRTFFISSQFVLLLVLGYLFPFFSFLIYNPRHSAELELETE